MKLKRALIGLLIAANILLNAFQLFTTFLLASKIYDYYGSLADAWIIFTLPLISLILFAAGIVLWFFRKKPWLQFLIAAPLIIGIVSSFTPLESLLKTSDMRQFDERNKRHMDCIFQYQKDHPTDTTDWMTACPF